MTAIPADEFALGILRRHRDAATRPDMQAVADETGLTRKEVDALWDRLLSGKRDAFRSACGLVQGISVQRLHHRPAAPPAPTPEPWRALRNHPSPAVRKRYDAVEAAIVAAEKAALAADIAERRAAAKATLAALAVEEREVIGRGPVGGTCPDCGREGLGNVGSHRANAHGYRRPRRTKEAS